MPITFPLTPTLVFASDVSVSSAAVPYPSGIAADDILIMTVSCSSTNAVSITTPSGWTLLGSGTWTNGRGSAFYKVATGSESGNQAVSFSSSFAMICVMGALRGVDPAAIFDVAAVVGSSATLPSITTTVADTWRVDVVLRNTQSAITPHASQTERWEEGTTGPFSELAAGSWLATEARAAAGATGTRAITAAGTLVTISFAVAPIAPAPPVTGTAAVAIDAPALAATGTHAITGTAAPVIAAPTIAATGTETISGTAALAIAAPTIDANDREPVSGSAAVAIAGPILAATGTTFIGGTAAIAIDAPALETTGVETISGTAAPALAAPTLAATGTEAISGSGALAVGAPTLAATGTETISGTGAIVIGVPALAALGINLSATVAVVIAAPTIAGSGTITIFGSNDPGVARVRPGGVARIRRIPDTASARRRTPSP